MYGVGPALQSHQIFLLVTGKSSFPNFRLSGRYIHVYFIGGLVNNEQEYSRMNRWGRFKSRNGLGDGVDVAVGVEVDGKVDFRVEVEFGVGVDVDVEVEIDVEIDDEAGTTVHVEYAVDVAVAVDIAVEVKIVRYSNLHSSSSLIISLASQLFFLLFDEIL